MNTQISVIIPFYNCTNALSKLLDSILEGAVVPAEIILVNDGSTDSSLELAQKYAALHPFIKVLSQEHCGVSKARNLGLSATTGDWISFLDADDYVEPDMYSLMLESICNAPGGCSSVDGCICGFYTHKEGIVTPYIPKGSGILSSKDLLRSMFTDECVKGFLFTRLFKTSLLKEMAFDPSIKLCEDLLFQAQLFSAKDMRFVCLPVPLYHYIQNQSSATASKNFFDRDTFIYKPAFDRISKYVREGYVLSHYNSILDYSMYTLLNQYRARKDSATLSQIRLIQKEMRRTKTPLAQKSKRRIAYELAPIFLLLFLAT